MLVVMVDYPRIVCYYVVHRINHVVTEDLG